MAVHPLSDVQGVSQQLTASADMRAIEHTPTSKSESQESETVIAPTSGWVGVNWGELLRGRELLYFLIWRDIKVRYKQAMLGAAWVVLQPLFNIVLFTLVFGRVAGFDKWLGPGHEAAYPVFVLAALLPWQLFATALNGGSVSLLAQQNILTKIYFPRLYVPTSVVGGALVDLGISLVFVAVLMAWFHVGPSWELSFLPLLLVLTIICSLGVAYLFSAVTILYRDFRFLVPFIGQVWMYASFVAFPPYFISPKWRLVLSVNPMYGIVAAWRRILLPVIPEQVTGWDARCLAVSVVVTCGLFGLGLFYFRRTERRFADIA